MDPARHRRKGLTAVAHASDRAHASPPDRAAPARPAAKARAVAMLGRAEGEAVGAALAALLPTETVAVGRGMGGRGGRRRARKKKNGRVNEDSADLRSTSSFFPTPLLIVIISPAHLPRPFPMPSAPTHTREGTPMHTTPHPHR